MSTLKLVYNYTKKNVLKTLNYAIKTLKYKKQIFATYVIQICKQKKFLGERHRITINNFKSLNCDEKLCQFLRVYKNRPKTSNV